MAVANLLPVKSHQLYQDITLLKQHLKDFLTHLSPHTNQFLPQPQSLPALDQQHLVIDSHVDSSLTDNIKVDPKVDPNSKLIELFIEAPEMQRELKTKATLLRDFTDVQYYTDGSLQRDPTSLDSMGLGWVNVNQETVCFSASAILWPSSTKAEILACLAALIVSAPKAQVTLFTNSAATIAGFDNLNRLMQQSVRKREKTPNFQIWMTMDYIIRELDLNVIMIKVKAHNGDRLNDRADTLAKDAAFHAPRLNLNYLALPELALGLTCDNLTVETSSRRCIKQLFEAKSFYDTLQLQRHADLETLTSQQHINWSSTSFMLNHNTSENDRASTSFRQHKLRAFKYKLFSDELPTLVRFKIRRPDLYPEDACLNCQRQPETQTHLWSCTSHQAKWRHILNQAADLCYHIFQQHNQRTLPTKEAVLQLIHESRTFIAKGIMSQRCFNFVHTHIHSETTTHMVIAQVYNFVYRQVFNNI